MLGHITRYSQSTSARPVIARVVSAPARPHLQVRTPSALPEGWSTPPRAAYHFDAGWHTAQSLRRLIRASMAGGDVGIPQPSAMLARTVDTLLYSIRPGLKDGKDSETRFRKLLESHLSGLNADELAQLSGLLKSHRFECAIFETVVDDLMMEKFGFSNGGINQTIHALMYTKDLHIALSDMQETKARGVPLTDARPLSPAQAAQARDAIAAAAISQSGAAITLDELVRVAGLLAQAIGLPSLPAHATVVSQLSAASCVGWQGGGLLVDLSTFSALRQSGDRALYAEVLRDLLELVLARRLFGENTDLLALSQEQRSLLYREIEQVLSLAPTLADESASATAAATLKGKASFGTVQIYPTAGVNLGHASIEPTLSVMPDRTGATHPIGTRFMRSGARLEPVPTTVNEWQIRWLDAKDSAALYPAERAWQLPVPAQRARLQQAAIEIMEEWQRKSLPYRFIGTEPGMPATGCRATVWQAVQRAMDDDTRALFEHFRLGLPEPESPTELALRLEQFMNWLTVLATQPGHADL